MRQRLQQQNALKYVERIALDKDLLILLILKKALGNKIPVDELPDWEFLWLIESFKNSVDIVFLFISCRL